MRLSVPPEPVTHLVNVLRAKEQRMTPEKRTVSERMNLQRPTQASDKTQMEDR